jgi:hypothetical protein
MNGLGRSLPRGLGRLAGCFWLVLAAFVFMFMATAAGIGIDAAFLLPPLVLVPLILAIVVLIAGRFVIVLAVSCVAALLFAGLGIWNVLRAVEFERANPGSTDVSLWPSVLLVLLAIGIASWSVGAAGLEMRPRADRS